MSRSFILFFFNKQLWNTCYEVRTVPGTGISLKCKDPAEQLQIFGCVSHTTNEKLINE